MISTEAPPLSVELLEKFAILKNINDQHQKKIQELFVDPEKIKEITQEEVIESVTHPLNVNVEPGFDLQAANSKILKVVDVINEINKDLKNKTLTEQEATDAVLKIVNATISCYSHKKS